MPCDGSYMDPNHKEVDAARVACLLDELDGKPIDRDYWQGYHPATYCKRFNLDSMVAELCSKLQSVVKQYSLEMQIWWRDHQEADRARVRT